MGILSHLKRIAERLGIAGVAFLTLAVASCATPETGPTVLSAPEIRQTVTGNALTRCGSQLLGQWRYTGRHMRDGTMEAVVLAGARREDAAGIWRVTDEGLYCRTWNNAWAQGQEGCFRVIRSGQSLIFDHVSGAAGEATRYTYRLGEACP